MSRKEIPRVRAGRGKRISWTRYPDPAIVTLSDYAAVPGAWGARVAAAAFAEG